MNVITRVKITAMTVVFFLIPMWPREKTYSSSEMDVSPNYTFCPFERLRPGLMRGTVHGGRQTMPDTTEGRVSEKFPECVPRSRASALTNSA